jgi:hypothetical protein
MGCYLRHSLKLRHLFLVAAALLGAAAALPPEPHLSCGGNYGWMKTENAWSHEACPPPQWEPVWELNRSTTPWTPWGPESADAGAAGTLFSAVNASRWPSSHAVTQLLGGQPRGGGQGPGGGPLIA